MRNNDCEKNYVEYLVIAPVHTGKTNWSKYLSSRNDDFVYYGGKFNEN